MFSVRDEDIEIGRFDPTRIYSKVELLDDGELDTVRVTLRRDEVANASVSLFFAQLFGTDEAAFLSRSTAVLQKSAWIGPGADVFPFSIQHVAWSQLDYGDAAIIYGNGKISGDWGNEIPGNWGTLDIGPASNSTSSLHDQIINGLKQSDLDALAKVEGVPRIAPVYLSNNGRSGNNLEFAVDYWVALTVGMSRFKGSKNSLVHMYKSYIYNENLRPNPDLSNIDDVIEGAYTAAVLDQ